MLDPDHYVICPMPECGEALVLDWNLTLTLDPTYLDPAGGIAHLATVDAHTSSWQVSCTGGHVLLLPGSLGCPCEPAELRPDCPHNLSDYDWSEDSRTFQAHDMQRLRDVLARLGSPEATEKGRSDG
jgi:hypothetical protein